MLSCASLVVFLAGEARAGLRVDPAAPPEVVASYPDGGVRLRFPGSTVEVDSVGAVVVTLRKGAAVPAELRDGGRWIGDRNVVVPVRAGDDALSLSLRWATDPAVAAAIPDLVLHPRRTSDFTDPDYGGQWYLQDLGMAELYAQSEGDPQVKLAVVDGYIDITHPDLAPAVVAPYDAVNDDDDPTPPPDDCTPQPDCLDGHGTATSGISTARGHDGVGIVGMCPGCSLVPVALIEPSTTLSQDLAAFQHLVDEDVWVVNNSWGYTEAIEPPEALLELVDQVATENRGGLGAVVVFAAGNDDRKIKDFELEADDHVVCVSATDRYGLPTNYTNSGAAVDVAAPSATVADWPNGGVTETFGGTSAAAPVVAGLAGWMLSVDPTLSASDVRDLMIETAHKSSQVTFDENGHHDVYGFGEIDPPAILARMLGTDDTGVAEEDGGSAKGCGCASAPGSPVPLLGLVALFLRRRR